MGTEQILIELLKEILARMESIDSLPPSNGGKSPKTNGSTPILMLILGIVLGTFLTLVAKG